MKDGKTNTAIYGYIEQKKLEKREKLQIQE